MESESRAQRLAQLSAADKQRLLTHLLREKAKHSAAESVAADRRAWILDATLDPALQPLSAALHCSDPQTILLTGATGFLGAHLLQELCNRTTATIYCLVRAQNSAEAQERLRTSFARYFGAELAAERVRPLVGDLSQANLGLPTETYNLLARETDIIIHNGAHLHHMAPYAHLKASNVDSTIAMLQLAATAKPKWVHYVSTLVAAVDRDSEGWLLEGLPERDPDELAGGYAQSKWVSEKLLAEAARRGMGVSIFRPGFISGRSDNGIWPLENDHLLRVVKGCVQMGFAPESDLTPNMAPVDFVSAAIVRLALTSQATGGVFNLSNPHLVSWETLLHWLQSFGYELRVVSNEVWCRDHLEYLDKENALFPVLPLYLGGEVTGRHAGLLSKLAKVRNGGTTRMLAQLDTSFPVIDQALWRRYVRYFQESGFLPVPN